MRAGGRRLPRALAVVLAIAAVALLVISPANAATGNPGPLALGAEVVPSGTQTQQQAITAFEATTGHQLAFTREYLLWDSPFPTSYDQWLAARGTIPMVSVFPKTVSGTVIPWSSIAAAQPGDAVYARMKAWADGVKAFGSPVYFTFNHEPEAAASNV